MSEENKNNGDRLPRWPDIAVSLEIPSGFILDTNLTDDMLVAFEYMPTKTPGIRPFCYFKIRDENNELKTNFKENPLVLTIRYSPRAWNANTDCGIRNPRIFIRSLNNNTWEDDWEEIEANYINVDPPKKGKPFGTVTIELPSIPDPAIGGC